jgi:SpoVK/Ycf46/Vps4 family AAA+-type ATPase
MCAYDDTLAHLLAEMERVDLLLRAQVTRARQLNTVDERFQGLYISEQELDRLLARPNGAPSWALGSAEHRARVATGLEALKCTTTTTAEASLRAGTTLRLPRLAALYGLDAFETDCLLVCLATELDLRYERIYSYLQDDVTKKKPSVDLVLSLLSSSPHDKLLGRFRFADDAPLLQARLIEFVDDGSQGKPPLLARHLRIDDRIAAYLLGCDRVDARIRPFSTVVVPELTLDALSLDRELTHRLRKFTRGESDGKSRVLYLQGPYGTGRRAVARALCMESCSGSRPRTVLIEVDLEKLLSSGESTFASSIALVYREAALQDGALLFTGLDQLLTDNRRLLLGEFTRAIEQHPRCVYLSGEMAWEPRDALRNALFARVQMSRPEASRRAELWSAALTGAIDAEHVVDIQQLASRFRFSAGEIRDAAGTARNLAGWRQGLAAPVTMPDIYEACRLQSNQKLGSLSRKITPGYSWPDIVLPRNRLQQLRDICHYVEYRDRVLGEWGFGRKRSYGNGVSALFAGPSGTGKTMAAEIIAGELSLDLYKIDLSTVVSKFIGETEKNLSRIFTEAETSNAILFFDEADALFGKRSEVKDSHDRYANIEVGYLLQRIEEYDGVVILASNFRKNIDEAFVRRLQFVIEFPFPNRAERRRIWDVVWPQEAPKDPGINFDALAERYEITGGNIRNIALASAFLAAKDGRAVNMDHLFLATQRELQKMGKIVPDGAFEPLAERSGTAGRATFSEANPVS